MATNTFSFSSDDLGKVNDVEKVGQNMTSELKALIAKRKGKRSSATKTVNFVNDNLSKLSFYECESYFSKLKQLHTDLDYLDDNIMSLAIFTLSLLGQVQYLTDKE